MYVISLPIILLTYSTHPSSIHPCSRVEEKSKQAVNQASKRDMST